MCFIIQQKQKTWEVQMHVFPLIIIMVEQRCSVNHLYIWYFCISRKAWCWTLAVLMDWDVFIPCASIKFLAASVQTNLVLIVTSCHITSLCQRRLCDSRFVCFLPVTKITAKFRNRFHWNFQEMLIMRQETARSQLVMFWIPVGLRTLN